VIKMGAFENLIQMMAGMDIFQLFFPWLFVLAVSFGLLEKTAYSAMIQASTGSFLYLLLS